ncbi:hypothetical protein BDN72DRAFT_478324 [Pluteus cervinus]|uniref:Uncharacterized protein n=1 Tax=Pluteus cervinus TaxID=181527 RepID=A0ACD3A621_9AGAR|nr:hypothetical protein BDN72DRAFT_478324 [Pluteus cervinus]
MTTESKTTRPSRAVRRNSSGIVWTTEGCQTTPTQIWYVFGFSHPRQNPASISGCPQAKGRSLDSSRKQEYVAPDKLHSFSPHLLSFRWPNSPCKNVHENPAFKPERRLDYKLRLGKPASSLHPKLMIILTD